MTEQLDTGVRYLDLRVAHMPGGSARNLHFVHMVYTTALVEVGGGRGTGTHGHPRAPTGIHGGSGRLRGSEPLAPGAAAWCWKLVPGSSSVRSLGR